MGNDDEELAEIDALFARADQDHDGQINFTEFKSLMRRARRRRCPKRSCGSDSPKRTRISNSRINIDEFRAWWMSD